MGRLQELTIHDAQEIKALQLARYEDLLSGVWARSTGGDLWAVDRAVAVLDRIDKLEGTEAPRRRIVNVVDEDTLYEMTTRMERETDELERPPDRPTRARHPGPVRLHGAGVDLKGRSQPAPAAPGQRQLGPDTAPIEQEAQGRNPDGHVDSAAAYRSAAFQEDNGDLPDATGILLVVGEAGH